MMFRSQTNPDNETNKPCLMDKIILYHFEIFFNPCSRYFVIGTLVSNALIMSLVRTLSASAS